MSMHPRLVAYFPLDGDGIDASGNGHGATPTNTFRSNGRIGGATGFAGTDYMKCTNNAAFGGMAQLSVCFWAWLNSSIGRDNMGILGFDGAGITPPWDIHSEGGGVGKLTFRLNTYTLDLQRDAYWSTDSWHHYACTYDGANKRIYVDGVYEKLRAQTGAVNDASDADPLTIGRYANNNSHAWIGRLQHVHIFNVALPVSDIQRLMANPLSMPMSV